MACAKIQPGCLYVVATPIGNLEDITFRAARVLAEVELVAAEDTRRARILLSHLGLRPRLLSLFAGNEKRRTGRIVAALRQGRTVALISEAGMPGISDPGHLLIRACLEQDLAVDVLPGPSAAITALVLSGLPARIFTFLGFLPRRPGRLRRMLAPLRDSPATLVIYEAPDRAGQTLERIREVLGERSAALVREMTKVHQEVRRGSLSQLAGQAALAPPRGEVTLVVAGAVAAGEGEGEAQGAGQGHVEAAELRGRVLELLARGESPRAVADALAHLGRRRIYRLALALRREP